MQTITERPARDAAFGLLSATVSEFEAAGRPVYGAPLKVALQRRSGGWFDESKLGFSRFKSFLEAARDAGVVDFEPTPGGDLRVFKPHQDAPAEQLTPQKAPFVRRDLWRAFFDWEAPRERWYDRDKAEAVMLDTEAAVAAYLGGRSRDRLVRIEPVSMDTQLAWMREFADAAGERGTPLREALESDRPLAAFTQAVRHLDLSRRWREARQRRVIEALNEWAEANNVGLGHLESRPPRGDEGALPPRDNEAAIRGALHTAIDRMPLAELLRLSIPLEYLLP